MSFNKEDVKPGYVLWSGRVMPGDGVVIDLPYSVLRVHNEGVTARVIRGRGVTLALVHLLGLSERNIDVPFDSARFFTSKEEARVAAALEGVEVMDRKLAKITEVRERLLAAAESYAEGVDLE